MARTNPDLVGGVLMDDYGKRLNGKLPSLTPFIDTANAIVNRVSSCSVRRGIGLSSTELELVERWLAAHLYAMSDQTYSSRSTEGASGSFQGQTGMYLEATKYGQTALNIDVSGCLNSIGKMQRASVVWTGKPPSAQIDYKDRD